MKKLLLTLGLISSIIFSFSQTINTIPATGNVGLGTSSPSTKLQVCGDVKIDSSLTVKAQLDAKSDLKVDGSLYLAGDMFFTSPVQLSSLPLKLASFEPNGQIRGASIGSITPLLYQEDCIQFMDINGTISAYPAPVWQSSPGPNHGVLFTGTGCPAYVGIGTDNPLAALDVIGRTHVKYTMGIGISPTPNTVLSIKEITDPDYSTTTLIQAIGNNGEFNLRSNGEIELNSNTTDYSIIIDNSNSSGQGIYIEGGDGSAANTNYGLINVTAGGKQIFYVDGKNSITYAREVKVNTNAVWPDYVFEENYERMTSEEKEKYFKENKHLPGIAPASEMEKDGIPVSATLTGLTKNVEENSLDINLLFDELQKLKIENEKLKEEIEILKNK